MFLCILYFNHCPMVTVPNHNLSLGEETNKETRVGVCLKPPREKTGNVRFHKIEKIEKQSIKTLYCSLEFDILTAD